MNNVLDKIQSLDKLIGNTPLIEISFKYKDIKSKIFAKLEYYNYTGSIKDRMALHILKKAYMSGSLKNDDIIVETTSGNTGISFAAIGTYLGNKVHIFMPDWMSEERKNILKSFNAELFLVSKQQGGFLKCLSLAEEVKKTSKNIFLPYQFSNPDNTEAHFISTGPEIEASLKKANLNITDFVAGVGTGGTVMGIGKYMRTINPNVRLYPLEPSNSPTLSTGIKGGSHRIQGISDEFVPDIIDFNFLNDVISVDDGDAIIMAQLLSKKLGLGVGISSGANFLGAVKALIKNNFAENSVVVTVFPDDNKKYVSTDLMKKEPIKNGFISSFIELINIEKVL